MQRCIHAIHLGKRPVIRPIPPSAGVGRQRSHMPGDSAVDAHGDSNGRSIREIELAQRCGTDIRAQVRLSALVAVTVTICTSLQRLGRPAEIVGCDAVVVGAEPLARDEIARCQPPETCSRTSTIEALLGDSCKHEVDCIGRSGPVHVVVANASEVTDRQEHWGLREGRGVELSPGAARDRQRVALTGLDDRTTLGTEDLQTPEPG